MSRQTIELKSEHRIYSYCAIHSDQDVEIQINQREGGLIDCITQPCPQCLAESEAFGRANQRIDDERKVTE
jgi:hypothetical protein